MFSISSSWPSRIFVVQISHILIENLGFSERLSEGPMHACWIISVMSDSLQLCELQPAKFLCPWDSLGKNTRVCPPPGDLPDTGIKFTSLFSNLHRQAGPLPLVLARAPGRAHSWQSPGELSVLLSADYMTRSSCSEHPFWSPVSSYSEKKLMSQQLLEIREVKQKTLEGEVMNESFLCNTCLFFCRDFYAVLSCSIVSNSLWPHGLWSSRLLCQNFPGKKY